MYLGLGVVKSLEPDRRDPPRAHRRPRPGSRAAHRPARSGPPESYQPWAVIDALLVARPCPALDDLEVVGADINPRVVDHLRARAPAPPSLTLVSGIAEDENVQFSDDYRDYFAQLGPRSGAPAPPRGAARGGQPAQDVRVSPAAARALRAAPLDIVTERLDGPPFDLSIATNILPYFDDVELMLAMTNIAAMLAPGGVFLHNEARPALQGVTDAARPAARAVAARPDRQRRAARRRRSPTASGCTASRRARRLLHPSRADRSMRSFQLATARADPPSDARRTGGRRAGTSTPTRVRR